MGVRGKIEAVIYAAEEPVTLNQLVTLFGDEALAERTAAVAVGDVSAEMPVEEVALEAELQVEGDSSIESKVQDSAVLFGETDGDRRAARSRDREAREAVRALLAELMQGYDEDRRGMEIREIAGGYRIATKPEYHDAVRAFVKSLKPVMKLSLQALETLAVIAYKQPVTSPEVSEIRGVDSGGVLGSLISRKLVTTAGRKQVVGRPILYKTTKEFLLRFGLKDLAELPSMEEFEKMAGELQGMSEEPGESAETAGAADDAASFEPVSGEALRGEKPVSAPSRIKILVEEQDAPGISVTPSGTTSIDPEASESTLENDPEEHEGTVD